MKTFEDIEFKPHGMGDGLQGLIFSLMDMVCPLLGLNITVDMDHTQVMMTNGNLRLFLVMRMIGI